MPQNWKWSFGEALSIVGKTYLEDWGRAKKDRIKFLQRYSHIEEIRDKHIRGLSSGDGDQAVIFIHGSPANAMRWAFYLVHTPDDYQFVSIDRMGFGDRRHQTPDLEEDYLHISNFVSQFEEPIIIGHSLGGAVATRLSTEHNIKKMILIASSIDPSLERIRRIQKIGANAKVGKALSRSIRHSNSEMIQLPNFLVKTEESLSQIKTSVDIIHPRDDGLVPFDNVEYALQNFTNAEDINVIAPEKGGHKIPWKHPELIFKSIKATAL